MNGLTRRERLIEDENIIKVILEKSKVLHLGLVDGDEPYVVPMNYGHVFENGKLTLWLHGAKTGRKLDVMRKNPKVFISMECDIVPFAQRRGSHPDTLQRIWQGHWLQMHEEKYLPCEAPGRCIAGLHAWKAMFHLWSESP